MTDVSEQRLPCVIDAVLVDTPLVEPRIELARGARDGAVLRCRDHIGHRYALKAIDTAAPPPDDDLTVDRGVTVRHEADVLRHNPNATDHLFIASGQLDSMGWLLTRWIDGVPSGDLAQDLRSQGSTQALCALARAIVERVARLHATRYVHGDLQPAHCIARPDGTIALIDFEFAHRPGDDTIAYLGGLVHYNAPEIAQALLDRRLPAPYDQRAEIYSLGSMLHHLTTGRTSTDYGSADHDRIPYEDKLRMIATGHRDLTVDSSVPRVLRDLIAACLADNPAQRLALEVSTSTVCRSVLTPPGPGGHPSVGGS